MNTQETTTVRWVVNAEQAQKQIEALKMKLSNLNGRKRQAVQIERPGVADETQKKRNQVTADLSRIEARIQTVNHVERYVQAYADMAEHEAGVAKYTGMTREEVDALNESFRQMDTRTPREKLNDLAGDAGRLGIIQLLATSGTLFAF